MDIPGQAIVLILFVVISGIQWLIKKIQEKNGPHDTPDSLEDIYDEFREEIRQRQTVIEQPPPPPLPVNTTPAAPEPSYTQVTHVEQPVTPQFTQPEPAELTTAQQEAAARFEQLGKKKRRQSATHANSTARALLSNPQSARQAVILQEIFSKPRSMQRF